MGILGKAAGVVDDTTGGTYTDHIAKGEDAVRQGLDSLDGDQGDLPRTPPS